MRILIGYDGSSQAENALEDLSRAGLPPAAEVLVITVDELWGLALTGDDSEVEEGHAGALHEALVLAEQASELLRLHFPAWEVCSEAYSGSPARVIIRRADEWRADLLISGAQSRSTAGRYLLGSVAQQIATEAHCSVRVARSPALPGPHPARILIGVDGSPNSEAAVSVVASRNWPEGSEVKIMTSMLHAPLITVSHPGREWYRVREIQLAAETSLKAAGLAVSSSIEEGDPKRVLVDEAVQWSADSIFAGATSSHKITRFLLGSVPTAILTRARCSVEVVRASRATIDAPVEPDR